MIAAVDAVLGCFDYFCCNSGGNSLNYKINNKKTTFFIFLEQVAKYVNF